MVAEVTGLAPQAAGSLPLADSQMVAGDTLRVTVARWSATSRPYFRTGYWFAVPKSHGSCVPARSGSRSMSQSL